MTEDEDLPIGDATEVADDDMEDVDQPEESAELEDLPEDVADASDDGDDNAAEMKGEGEDG